jgi:hypothetical protein
MEPSMVDLSAPGYNLSALSRQSFACGQAPKSKHHPFTNWIAQKEWPQEGKPQTQKHALIPFFPNRHHTRFADASAFSLPFLGSPMRFLEQVSLAKAF